jgi:hypothetical protein
MDDNIIKFQRPKKKPEKPAIASARRKLLVIGIMIVAFILAYKFLAVTPPR